MARCIRCAVVPCINVPPVGAQAAGRAMANTVDISELANAGVACFFSSLFARDGSAKTLACSFSGGITPLTSRYVPYQGKHSRSLSSILFFASEIVSPFCFPKFTGEAQALA